MQESPLEKDQNKGPRVLSEVCVPCSDRNVFAAGTMLKAKVGQAFEYLQARDSVTAGLCFVQLPWTSLRAFRSATATSYKW